MGDTKAMRWPRPAIQGERGIAAVHPEALRAYPCPTAPRGLPACLSDPGRKQRSSPPRVLTASSVIAYLCRTSVP